MKKQWIDEQLKEYEYLESTAGSVVTEKKMVEDLKTAYEFLSNGDRATAYRLSAGVAANLFKKG